MPLRANQSDGYRALFDSAADSLRDVAKVTRALRNCQLGFFGVLQTWGRDPLVYNPHVHFVVPGGGVRVDRSGQALSWSSTGPSWVRIVFVIRHRSMFWHTINHSHRRNSS